MAYDIGPRIGIEGEAEYREALQQIITTQKTLATEMQATSSAFDKGEKSMASYTAKNAVLEKQIAAQREKMELLRRAVDEATQKYGEADTRTQKWQQVMNRATAELNEMERELRDNKTAMEQLGNATEDAAKKHKSLIDRLKDNATFTDVINLARASAGAIREIADAMISCATDAAAWADEIATLSVQTGVSTQRLQQLDYATGLLDVSLETISGALSRNTKAMAAGNDSYAKLGVSVRDANGELRNSEDVFFETLDALGKIENETERDAAAMELFGKSAKELNPLIEAGSERLRELAQEAHDAGYVLDNDAFDALTNGQDALDRFEKSTQAAKNAVGAQLMPALASLAGGGGSVLSAFAKTLNQTGDASAAIAAGKDMVMGVLDGIIAAAPEMAQSAGAIVSELAVGIVNMAPQLVELGLIVLESFIEGIAENTDTLVPAIVDAIIKITETLLEHLPDLIAAAGELIGALASGLIQAIPQLVMQIPQIIAAILTALGEGFVEFLGIGVKMVEGIISGIKDSIGWVKEQVSAWVGDVIGFFKDMLGIHSPSDVMADLVGYQMGAGVGEGFAEGLSDAERDMAAAQEKLNRDLAGMAAGLETSTTVNMGTGPIEHHYSGTIRVEGVTDSGQFIASTDLLIEDLIDRLRREVRFA